MPRLHATRSRLAEIACYARETRSPRSFARLLRVRLSRSTVGPFVARAPRTKSIRIASLGGPVWLRSHSTDISVLSEIIFGHSLDGALDLAKAPALIVDLGANIGLASRWLLERYPDARLIAVEPDPGNLEMLEQNLAGTAATIVPACIGGRERHVRLVGDRQDGYTMVDDPAGPIEVIRMSALLEEHTRVGLLKVDIEGAEQELFDDCEAWLDRVDAMLVECHHPYTASALAEAIARTSSKMQVVWAGPMTRFGYQMAALRTPDVRSNSAVAPPPTVPIRPAVWPSGQL